MNIKNTIKLVKNKKVLTITLGMLILAIAILLGAVAMKNNRREAALRMNNNEKAINAVKKDGDKASGNIKEEGTEVKQTNEQIGQSGQIVQKEAAPKSESNNPPVQNNSSEPSEPSNQSKPSEQSEPSKPSKPSEPSEPSKKPTSTPVVSATNVKGLDPLPTKYEISVNSSQEQSILNLLNEKRRQAGIGELVMDNTLVEVARYKSNHMIQYGYFNHSTSQGTMWHDWLKKIGYSYNGTAENIAYNFSGPEELFNQWWNSQGHKNNMMNPAYTKIGIGVVHSKQDGKYMGTQTFSN